MIGKSHDHLNSSSSGPVVANDMTMILVV